MDGFPYPLRPGQKDLVDAITENCKENGQLVAESGTGTGKTISALFGARKAASHDGRRIIWATRTNSQQEQALREHANMQDETLMVPMMGRKHYCPLLQNDDRYKNGTSEELGRLCRQAKQKALQAHTSKKPVKGSCPFYEKLLADGTEPVEALLRSHTGSIADLSNRIAGAGSCAYEAFKLLLPDAHAVAVPYVFLIDQRLRTALMQWLGTTPEACHVVIDEAHNLPEATRGHYSPRLGLGTVERAIKEAEQIQDPVLGGTVLATSFLTKLHEVIRALVTEHAGDSEDGWMPDNALDEALMLSLRLPGPAIARIARDLHQWGEEVRERKRMQSKLPRSYLGAVGAFLEMWQEAREGPFIHLATRENRPALEAYLMDPAARLGWLHEFASVVHMSGTLAPFEGYQQETGLADARTLHIESPFDPRKLTVTGVLGIRRSYQSVQEDPTIIERHQTMGRTVLAGWNGRCAVWFPSHQMMADYLEEGFLHRIGRLYVEKPEYTTAQLLDLVARFSRDKSERAILVGVLGGRLTEGIDYPGNAMEQALIMGVPYPKPTARSQALIHYYESRGNGWQIAVHSPVGRVLKQAVGRLIRGPDDEGKAVILDERIIRFRDRFPTLAMAKDADSALSSMPSGGTGNFVPAGTLPSGSI